MVANRKRIPRLAAVPITPRAVDLFRLMQRLPAKCTCPDAPPWRMECPACEEWWAANSELCRLLQLPVWHFPAIHWGGAPTNEWKELQASLWHALNAAARAQSRAKAESTRRAARDAAKKPPLNPLPPGSPPPVA